MNVVLAFNWNRVELWIIMENVRVTFRLVLPLGSNLAVVLPFVIRVHHEINISNFLGRIKLIVVVRVTELLKSPWPCLRVIARSTRLNLKLGQRKLVSAPWVSDLRMRVKHDIGEASFCKFASAHELNRGDGTLVCARNFFFWNTNLVFLGYTSIAITLGETHGTVSHGIDVTNLGVFDI